MSGIEIEKTRLFLNSGTDAPRVGDPYGIRTHVTAVKGRCLNRLTKGPYVRRLKADYVYRIAPCVIW